MIEIILSLLVVSPMYFLVRYWDRKKQRERSKPMTKYPFDETDCYN